MKTTANNQGTAKNTRCEDCDERGPRDDTLCSRPEFGGATLCDGCREERLDADECRRENVGDFGDRLNLACFPELTITRRPGGGLNIRGI